jgi:hypothetical protein
MPSVANLTRSVRSRKVQVQRQCGGTGSRILNLGTRWIGVVSFMLQLLYREKLDIQCPVLMFVPREKWHILFTFTTIVQTECRILFVPTANGVPFFPQYHKHVSTRQLKEQIQFTNLNKCVPEYAVAEIFFSSSGSQPASRGTLMA